MQRDASGPADALADVPGDATVDAPGDATVDTAGYATVDTALGEETPFVAGDQSPADAAAARKKRNVPWLVEGIWPNFAEFLLDTVRLSGCRVSRWSEALPDASQPSGRRRGFAEAANEYGQYQLRWSAEDQRKAIQSPLLPSSQTGRQPDAVIRSALNHSALPGWCALRACARVLRVTVDAHVARTFKNFIYNDSWFQRLGLFAGRR